MTGKNCGKIAALCLAAAMLTGCAYIGNTSSSSGEKPASGASGGASDGAPSGSSDGSSYNGVSVVIGGGSSSGSSGSDSKDKDDKSKDEFEFSSTPGEAGGNSSENEDPPANGSEVAAGESFMIGGGETLYIESGETVTVNGTLTCLGGIVIKDGGTLVVNNELSLESGGAMLVSGKLVVGENGVVNDGNIDMDCDFADITCRGHIFSHITPPEPVEVNGVTYVGGVLIVNRQFSIPASYGGALDDDAYNALLEMREASGYPMPIISGYRSYEYQQTVFDYWCSIDGYEEASRYSALPGHSEHQTGLAIDITSCQVVYGTTAEGQWLAKNCYDYGFIIRYPQESEHITGYIYEPWHVRYVGKDVSRMVRDSGLTLEEFLGVY